MEESKFQAGSSLNTIPKPRHHPKTASANLELHELMVMWLGKTDTGPIGTLE